MFNIISVGVTLIIEFDILFILVEHVYLGSIFISDLCVPFLDFIHLVVNIQLYYLSPGLYALWWPLTPLSWLPPVAECKTKPHGLVVTVVIMPVEMTLHILGLLITYIKYAWVDCGTTREIILWLSVGNKTVLHEQCFMLRNMEEYEYINIGVFIS